LTKPLHILSTFTGLDSFTQFEVDTLLHHRGSDFTVYRNAYALQGADVMTEKDGSLLQMIVYSLMGNDSCGVEFIACKNYSIKIHHSKAVSGTYIYKTVLDACRDAGYLPIEKVRESGSPYLGLRVSKLDSPRLAAIVLWHSTVRATRELVRSIVLSLKRAPRAIGRHLPGSVRNFLQI